MAEWGLSLWQQAGDKVGRRGGGQRRKAGRERAGTEGMLVVSWAAGKRALANYTRFYAHCN